MFGSQGGCHGSSSGPIQVQEPDCGKSITQPPSVQLEVIPEDPLAIYNDVINEDIIGAIAVPVESQPDPHFILYSIIQVVSGYEGVVDEGAFLDNSYNMGAVRKALFEKYEELPEMILDAWRKKDFKSIRTLRILQKKLPDEDSTLTAGTPQNMLPITAQAVADTTGKSWNRTFIGPVAIALWEHITHYYKKKKPWYARYVAMVQSSGTGKSRTIDELSKTRFTIPLCLRPKHTTGYPYADDEVREFLTEPRNEGDARLHAAAFLLALFEHTETTLRSEFHTKTHHSDVAASFREYMFSTQSSSKRRTFFQTVVTNAKKYIYKCSLSRAAGNGLIARMRSACSSLASLLEINYPSSDEGPILLIAWDEAHTLIKRVTGSARPSWSHFTALGCMLHELKQHPIVSIFSSTTSKLSNFSPPGANDVSSQVVNKDSDVFTPFSDFGFDLLAIKEVSVDDGQTLDEFTTTDYMCHLGRPKVVIDGILLLMPACRRFGSRYDSYRYGDDDLLEFAAGKLVGNNQIPWPSDAIQKVACLSSRIPVQFHSVVYTSREHNLEEHLVEGHMRICLKVDESCEFIHVISGSEPILSEASYFVTNRRSLAEGRKVSIEAFRHITEGFAIHSGDRGEFVALLLCTLARDSTVGLPVKGGQPSGSRHFSLTKFLCDNLVQDILASDESKANLELLRSDFPRAVLHFNHFIKAHEQAVIKQESLDGLQMKMNNFGLILAQVKNDSKYGAGVQEDLFERMNPYKLHILVGDQATPMIRIVFALASARPSVQVTRHEPSVNYGATIYDIWVAGITPDVLHPIDSNLQGTWKALLQASSGWKRLFNAAGPNAKDVRRSMDAAAARDIGHWKWWSKWSQWWHSVMRK